MPLQGEIHHQKKREDARTSGFTSSISWWFPMTEPFGIDVLVCLHMGAGELSQGETGDFLSIMPIYTVLGHRSAQCARSGSDEKSSFLPQSPSNIRSECGWLNMRSRRQRLKQGLKEDKMEW
jgi:hypothetical protein